MSDAITKRMSRSSNLELLRVFCIIAIIADHFTGQSGVVSFGTLQESFFYSVLCSLSRVSCSVFVIISSWFLIDRPFKAKRVFHTWFTVVTYAVSITLIAKYMFSIEVSGKNLYLTLFPLEESTLWFAGYYIVLITMAPFLNILIRRLERSRLEIILYLMFIAIVLYSTITCRTGKMFENDIWPFLFLYFMTGYLKKYSISFNGRKCLISFLLVESIMCSVKALTSYYSGLNLTLISILGQYAEFYRGNLQTLPNLLLAYSLFFFFKDLKIRGSRLINTLASASLGVYCMHQVPVFYRYMWEHIFQAPRYAGQGIRTQIYTILVILIVWLGGTAIELARMKLMDILVESRKWYGSLCLAVDQAVNSAGEGREAVSEARLRKLKRAGILLFALYFLSGRLLLVHYSWYLPLSADNPVGTEQMKLALEADVHYGGGSVQGTVTVRNGGAEITDISDGKYPIRVVVSLVDADGSVLKKNYLRLDIGDSIGSGEETEIPVQISGLEKYRKAGGGIRFAIVQKGVQWREDTAVFYWFEEE